MKTIIIIGISIGIIIACFFLLVFLYLGVSALIRIITKRRPHEPWDDIDDYDFQNELNKERKKEGLPPRNLNKYKK